MVLSTSNAARWGGGWFTTDMAIGPTHDVCHRSSATERGRPGSKSLFISGYNLLPTHDCWLFRAILSHEI